MPLRTVHTNFTGGEIGTKLTGRSNLQLYQDGMAEIRNYRVMPQGGLVRRPGTSYCATLLHAPYQVEDFVFNSEQAYLFLFSDARLEVFDYNGHLLQDIPGCKWSQAMVGELSVTSGGDFTFVCHPDLQTQQIKRTSATTFQVADYAYEKQLSSGSSPLHQPYYKYAEAKATLRVFWLSNADASGYDPAFGYTYGSTAQIQCSHNFFTIDYIGQYLKIGTGQVEITAVNSPTECIATVRTPNLRVKMSQNPLSSTAGSDQITVFQPYHGQIAGNAMTVYMSEGFRNLTSIDVGGHKIVSSYKLTADTWSFPATRTADQSATGGGVGVYFWGENFVTTDWAEPSYSKTRGYPHCAAFHANRLVFGGGKNLPNRLNFSQVDAPFNHDVGTGLDNEAIQLSITSKRTPIVRHLVSDKHLQVFTSEGEFYAPFGIDQKPLTPATVSIRDQTTYGSISRLRPARFDGSTLFITKSLTSVRELAFGSNDAGYSAPNVAFQAQHLLNNPRQIAALVENAEQQEATAYIVNGDGTLVVFGFVRKEQIAAWALWSTQGLYKNVCTVERRVFFVVERVIAGVTKTFLELMNADTFLDCSLQAFADGPEGWGTTWGLWPHLAGATVDVVADRTGYLGTAVVGSNARFTTTEHHAELWAGFTFAPTTLTLPPEVSLADGPTLGQPRRVVRVVLLVADSVAASVDGNHFVLRRAEQDLTEAPTAMDGQMEFWLLGWDAKGQVRITAPEPVPFTLLGMMVELDF